MPLDEAVVFTNAQLLAMNVPAQFALNSTTSAPDSVDSIRELLMVSEPELVKWIGGRVVPSCEVLALLIVWVPPEQKIKVPAFPAI